MALSKEDLKQRLHHVKVRQRLLKSIATVMSEQLALRLHGLQKAHPESGRQVAEWMIPLKVARLQQDKEALREVEWSCLEYLQAKGWEEFWYRDSVEGAEVVVKHYCTISLTIGE